MKTQTILLSLFVAVALANGASVTVQNLNSTGDAAFGLFDSSGTLVDGEETSNIRIGYFTGGFDADAAWASGNISALDSNFVTFGSAFGMFGAGFDGAFQGAPSTFSDPFAGNAITIWATDGSAFSSQSGEHLIYTFTSLTFQAETWNDGTVLLGTDAGSFLNSSGSASGGFANYSNDFGFGGGSLSGFNTVGAVPEPSTYAAIAGFVALGCAMYRRRRA